MKIGGATVNQIPLDWNNNLSSIVGAIEEARRQQIRFLCLPELLRMRGLVSLRLALRTRPSAVVHDSTTLHRHHHFRGFAHPN
jgi:predicted amidohydrolase